MSEHDVKRLTNLTTGVGRSTTGTAALTRAYRDKMDTVCLDDPQRRTYAEMIVDRVVSLALDGSMTAAIEICDRVEGRARQSVSVQQESVYDVDAANEILYQAMLEDEAKKVQ